MFSFFILSDVLQGLLEPLQDKKSDFVLSEDFENAKFAESSDFLSWYAFPESGLWDISSSGRSGKVRIYRMKRRLKIRGFSVLLFR